MILKHYSFISASIRRCSSWFVTKVIYLGLLLTRPISSDINTLIHWVHSFGIFLGFTLMNEFLNFFSYSCSSHETISFLIFKACLGINCILFSLVCNCLIIVRCWRSLILWVNIWNTLHECSIISCSVITKSTNDSYSSFIIAISKVFLWLITIHKGSHI